MKILITGGSGFIGSHLGNRLVELGHEVIGWDGMYHASSNKTDFEVVAKDFDEIESFSKYDVVVHLAAHINVDESIADPMKYFRNNAMKTLGMLDKVASSRLNRPRIIFASSAEVYGSARMEMMSEDHPLDPLSPYAVSKLAAEQMVKNFAQLHGLDATIVRNFNTFGEHQNGGVYGGVIAKFKKQATEKKPLTVYGSGEQMRDYMHVSQAVDGYVLAIERRLPLIVNFGSGRPIRIIDIANHVARKFGVGVIHLKPRPNEIMRLQADVSRATQYGYKVGTDFWAHLEAYLESKS